MTCTELTERRRRSLIAVIVTVSIALLVAIGTQFVSSQAVSDLIGNNETNTGDCSRAVSSEKAQAVSNDVVRLLGQGYDTRLVQRCDAFIIEIQYGSDELRRNAKQVLDTAGAIEDDQGWFYKSTPISLRNA